MLPAVLLIGDSIRAGYQPFVVEALRGSVDVEPGADHGGTSARIRANLQAIFARFAELGVPVVWATTTPVDEVRHHRIKPFDRLEADVTAYNAAAVDIARALELPVDDLYGVAVARGWTDHLTDDGVHFTEKGYRLLGGAVAGAVRDGARGSRRPAGR